VPGLALGSVLGLAADNGYDGVELRCAEGEPVHPDLPSTAWRSVRRAFARSRVVPVGLASYVRVAEPGDDQPVIDSLTRHVALAAGLDIPTVRVFPGGEDTDAAVRRLRSAAVIADTHGVRLLVETHDTLRNATAVASLLDRVDSPAVGAIWDVLHTHLAGDDPTHAARTLLPHLGYAQVKDITAADDLTPARLGAGALPLARSVDALLDTGYRGWFVWEHEGRWFPVAPPLPTVLAEGREWLRRCDSWT
jgi:sugar phosphate isomerase/epimerase